MDRQTPIRVLIVDDNEDAATSLGQLLGMLGFEIATCFSPREALRIVHSFDPDACILDINMPEMSGYELARAIRTEQANHIPLLATVTAYSDMDHLERAVDAGFDLHFTKAANPIEVAEEVRRLVDANERRHDATETRVTTAS